MPAAIVRNRSAFEMVFFLKVDDNDGVTVELKRQYLMKVDWIQNQEKALQPPFKITGLMEQHL